MSKIIASAAIRGAHKIFRRAEEIYKGAMEKYGPDQAVAFPNTAYYLPIIYSMTASESRNSGTWKRFSTYAGNLYPRR